jgi:hypothetical protein
MKKKSISKQRQVSNPWFGPEGDLTPEQIARMRGLAPDESPVTARPLQMPRFVDGAEGWRGLLK